MPFRFDDKTVNSVPELLRFVEEDLDEILESVSVDSRERFPGIWYRGLGDIINHKLLPTLHRNQTPVSDEIQLMNRFKQNAHEFLDYRPQGEWEWMFLMRHHKLPSRLLDWTESPLIGTYFAVEEIDPQLTDDGGEPDGVLWCLLPTRLNEIASSDTIRTDVVPLFDDEEHETAEALFLRNYLRSRVAPTISNVAVTPAAGISIRITKRIQAQQGVFTIHHADRTPIESVNDTSHLWRYIIPKESKQKIRTQLRRLQITKLTVFPELDNVAGEAKRGF